MRILNTQFLSGPNVHGPRSTLIIDTDFGTQAELLSWRPDTVKNETFARRLAGEFPASMRPLAEVWRDACAHGTAGFADDVLRLAQAAIADQTVGPSGGAVLDQRDGVLRVAMECNDAVIGRAAWVLAVPTALLCVSMAESAKIQSDSWQSVLRLSEDLRSTMLERGLNQLTMALVRAAVRRDIPWQRLLPIGQFVQLGQGYLRKRLNETMLDSTSYLPVRIAANKSVTGQLLRELWLPAPAFVEVNDEAAAVRAAAAIGYPVVVKPCHGKKGQAVAVRLTTEAQVQAAFRQAHSGGDAVLVQAFVLGDDHRLLVVDGKLVATARRVPVSIEGDGVHSVADLITILNRDPRRGRDYTLLMERVDIDGETEAVLAAQGLQPDSIPVAGRRVALRRTANISRGGTAQDVTTGVHPDNRLAAERAARIVGLDVAGIDFITPDIARSWREVGGGIIEVNPNPGLRPHWLGDPSREVVDPILDRLFAPGTPARIPICAVTGSLGKTTTSRMVAAIVRSVPRRVGMCTTQGMYLDDECLQPGDLAGGGYAARLLLHPDVEVGVFELARGGLLKHGMSIDAVDVGAVLNIREQHVGQDGITSLDQLARIKRLVIEQARRVAVLNAEDARCLAMMEYTSARVCLVGTARSIPAIERHLAGGGEAVVLEGNGADARIVWWRGSDGEPIIRVDDIPATYAGQARVKAINASFAVAIAGSMGFTPQCMRTGLRAFGSSYEQNPGRLNLVDCGLFKVVLDISSAPENIAALAEFVNLRRPLGRRLLLLTGPGNRPDGYLLGAGRAAAGRFDAYLCSDRLDRRGRRPGEAAQLLVQGLREGGVPADRIQLCPDEHAAFSTLLAMGQAGDLVAIITFSYAEAMDAIRSHGR